MNILVSPVSRVAELVAEHAPERVVSLLDPGVATPDLGPAYLGRHLRLTFHDAHEARDGYVVPSEEHIRPLLAFVSAWTRTAPILVHCRAGIGRSTAAAFVTACLHNPGVSELAIAHALRAAGPLARPNETLVGLADRLMGRGGRMSSAIAETGEGLPWIEVSENEPFVVPGAFVTPG